MATDLTWPITAVDVCKVMGWNTDRENEVEDYAAAAVTAIERKVGPWHGQPLQHAVTVRALSAGVILPWPVETVDTVTVDGAEVTPEAVSPEAGIVYLPSVLGRVVVTATARAAASVPEPVILAGRALAVFWAKQELVGPRVPGSGRAGSVEKDADVLQGFALPRRVSEMIRDYVLTGGSA